MKISKLLVIILVLISAIVSGSEERKIQFQLKCDSSDNFTVKIEMHAKTTMAMLFMPEITTYMRFGVEQLNSVMPDKTEGRLVNETTVATATLEYYLPGQPNQSLPDNVIDDILWNSGLGGRNARITMKRDKQGGIFDLAGVPEKYQAYYRHDTIYYPEFPVKPGDTWNRQFVQSLAVDPNQPPYDFDIKGTYTFNRLLNEEKEAEIAFKFESVADYAMQNGKKIKVDVRLVRSGKMVVRVSDGWPISFKSHTDFDFIYSANNFVKSSEDTSAVYTPLLTDAEKK